MFVQSKSEKSERTQSAAAGHAGRSKKGTCCILAGPVQRRFPTQQAGEQSTSSISNTGSGIPESVQTKMEQALNTNLAGVTVHPNSAKATEVGALAYTQGTDIHVAPGHYSPNTSSGQRLLGHELTHVAQQMAGRVQPTGEVGGLPLNDSPALEKEADSLGAKAG
jgi:hypothetical protein